VKRLQAGRRPFDENARTGAQVRRKLGRRRPSIWILVETPVDDGGKRRIKV